MPLEEDVDFLGDLDPNSPGPAEFKSEGDDHFRNLKKALRQSFPGATGPILAMGTATGPADAYVLNPARPLVEYRANMLVAFRVTDANATTAPTLNISSNGAKTIKAVDGGDLAVGDLPANSYQFLLYDGTKFVLQAPTKGYVDRVVAALKAYTDQLALAPAFPNQAGNAGKVATTDGANVSWQWAQNMKRLARTANTMLVQADRAKLVDITSGTFTQTFDTPANLGDGWYAVVCNAGSGDITIPASDGVTNWIMYPGEVRLFQCDGTSLRSKVLHPFYRVFSTTSNFAKAPGYSRYDGEAYGAGGSGAKHSSFQYTHGGAGGACTPFSLPATALGATEVVTIGAPGAAVTAADTNGNPGGNTSLGTLVTSQGGAGGKADPSSSATANATGGVANVGFPSIAGAYINGGDSGSSSTRGGAGGGGMFNFTPSNGGLSLFAGAGGAASAAGAAGDGVAPSGGGGATRSGTSGAGARGELRIWGVV